MKSLSYRLIDHHWDEMIEIDTMYTCLSPLRRESISMSLSCMLTVPHWAEMIEIAYSMFLRHIPIQHAEDSI
jgi:hypothetical protein